MPYQNWQSIQVQQLPEAQRKLGIGQNASVDSSWNFDTSTVASNPGTKRFRMDNATLASVTALYLNDTTVRGFDISTLAGFLAADYPIYVQQKSDPSKAALFKVTGPATDNTGWWTVPVSVVASGTIFSNNAECGLLFMLTVSP